MPIEIGKIRKKVEIKTNNSNGLQKMEEPNGGDRGHKVIASQKYQYPKISRLTMSLLFYRIALSWISWP
jgi:hypothetical protein